MDAYFQKGIQLEPLAPGESLYLPVTLKDEVSGLPINLDGYNAKMQVRQTADGADPALLTFSTDDNSIIITAVTGLLEIYGTPAMTVDLQPGMTVWDLFIYKDGVATKILYGTLPIEPSVTR